jgi:hypothetical protein
MEYILILIVAAVAGGFFLFRPKHSAEGEQEEAEATYVCDVCGEQECICRRVDEK